MITHCDEVRTLRQVDALLSSEQEGEVVSVFTFSMGEQDCCNLTFLSWKLPKCASTSSRERAALGHSLQPGRAGKALS